MTYIKETYLEFPPISQCTVSRIEAKYWDIGYVQELPKTDRPSINENFHVDLLLATLENSHSTLHKMVYKINVEKTTTGNLFKTVKYYPYKVRA